MHPGNKKPKKRGNPTTATSTKPTKTHSQRPKRKTTSSIQTKKAQFWDGLLDPKIQIKLLTQFFKAKKDDPEIKNQKTLKLRNQIWKDILIPHLEKAAKYHGEETLPYLKVAAAYCLNAWNPKYRLPLTNFLAKHMKEAARKYHHDPETTGYITKYPREIHKKITIIINLRKKGKKHEADAQIKNSRHRKNTQNIIRETTQAGTLRFRRLDEIINRDRDTTQEEIESGTRNNPYLAEITNQDGSTTLADTITDTKISSHSQREIINKLTEFAQTQLTPREQIILHYQFLTLDLSFQDKPLPPPNLRSRMNSWIARQLDLTPERIRQLEKQILQKLKAHIQIDLKLSTHDCYCQ
jgi:DNA-directed RNA polymerase specialized sigma subunit